MSEENKAEIEEVKKDLEHVVTDEEKAEIAQAGMCVNLYRQFHIINGGIERLNKEVFINLSPKVLELIKHIPGGTRLYAHITELKSGEGDMATLKSHLLPFGMDPVKEYMPEFYEKYYKKENELHDASNGKASAKKPKVSKKDAKEAADIMGLHSKVDKKKESTEKKKVEDTVNTEEVGDIFSLNSKKAEMNSSIDDNLDKLKGPGLNEAKKENKAEVEIETSSTSEMEDFFTEIENFKPSPANIKAFKELPYFQRYLPNWVREIRNSIREFGGDKTDLLLSKFEQLTSFDMALGTLNKTKDMLSGKEPLDVFEITRKIKQYEKHLPMFSEYGNKLLEELKARLKES